jgi:hypothetical protein
MKAMKLMQRMPPKQQRRRIAGILFFDAGRHAFGQRVVAGIVGDPGSGDELVAKLLERVSLAGRPFRARLQVGDRAIDCVGLAAGCQRRGRRPIGKSLQLVAKARVQPATIAAAAAVRRS